MASTGAGYDLSPTTFSPDGRIFQVEYATKAVENSGTVVGIRCADGVVLGVEKVMLSKMLLPSSNRRVAAVAPQQRLPPREERVDLNPGGRHKTGGGAGRGGMMGSMESLNSSQGSEISFGSTMSSNGKNV